MKYKKLQDIFEDQEDILQRDLLNMAEGLYIEWQQKIASEIMEVDDANLELTDCIRSIL